MDTDETTQQQPYQEPYERRRCEHIVTGGNRCRRWADRDAKMCHAHRMYAESYGLPRIEVPLLEDEAAILHVLSQTAQALARAAMPPANGLAVIGACRLATGVLDLRLRKARFAASQKRVEAAKTPAPMQEPEVKQPEPEGVPVRLEAPEVEEAEPGILCEAAAAGEWLEWAMEETAGADTEDSQSDAAGALDAPAGDVFREARLAAEEKTAARKARREAREGPTVDLPRFCPDDLESKWERGLIQPFEKNEKNIRLSKKEIQHILEWQRQHPAEMKAREQRMLDEYFGRVQATEEDCWD